MTTCNMKFKNLEEVREYAERQDKVILVHQDRILDVTTFQSHHPGGKLLLRNANLKNIDYQMAFHHPLTVTMADSMAIGSFKTEIQKLVDPSKPLGQQIWNKDHETYLKLVNSPHWLFVQSPRFFSNEFLELSSHTKWWMVPIFPCLLAVYNFSQVKSWESFNILTFLLSAIGGSFLFSIVFIFHAQNYLPKNKFLRHCHFFTHGVHHMLPNDPDRLVLPMSLFVIFNLLVTQAFFKNIIVIDDPVLYATFWSFFVLSYSVYDMIHYAYHFADATKRKGTLFHKLQKYHLRHHFSGEEAGYGVSSPLWDIIMRTGFKGVKKL